METKEKEIQELGAVVFQNAKSVAKAIREYGVMIVSCTDGEHQFLIFKTNSAKSTSARLGDAFIVDVPGISQKYEAREKKDKKCRKKGDKDEVRSV